MSPISLSPPVLTASVGVFLSGGGGDDEAVRTASANRNGIRIGIQRGGGNCFGFLNSCFRNFGGIRFARVKIKAAVGKNIVGGRCGRFRRRLPALKSRTGSAAVGVIFETTSFAALKEGGGCVGGICILGGRILLPAASALGGGDAPGGCIPRLPISCHSLSSIGVGRPGRMR